MTIWIDMEDDEGRQVPVEVVAVPRVGEHFSFAIFDVNPELWDDVEPLEISGRVRRVTHRCREQRRTRVPRLTAEYVIQLDRGDQ